jgi:hypothetical protein
MPIDQLNPDVWKLVGRMDALWSRDGGENFGWGTVATQSQTLTAAANLGVYKLMQGDQSRTKDYFLVAGDVFHGIQGSPQDPGSNWVSVGHYANYMKLKLFALTPGAKVNNFGPNSSVETANIGFSVGGSLSAGASKKDGPNGEVGINASVSISFSASEVSFRASPATTSVEWYTRLPHVGWISPGIPANPGISSYGGYLWNPAVIFEVPEGQPLRLAGTYEVDFEYNWTRGIRKRWFTPVLDLRYQADGKPGLAEEKPRSLPTIVERLHELAASAGQDGETDAFLAVVGKLGLLDSFGDSTLEQIVVVPSNKAIEGYFAANPSLSLEWSGVHASRWWNDWTDRRINNLPPGASANPALMAQLRKALSDTDRHYPCADGVLIVTDDYKRSETLAKSLQEMVPA